LCGGKQDSLRYLRKAIEDKIRILQEVKQTAKPEYQHIYDCNIKTLEWVLTQFPKGEEKGE
jgi:hypothetical protein